MRLHGLLLTILLSGAAPAAHAQPAPERVAHLARGVNFTNWFRFPARTDDGFLRDYISDATLRQLRDAGFTFVRLAVQPELMLNGGRPDPHRLSLLSGAIARIERQGLAVMVGWHPQTWGLEHSPAQQQQLQDLWGALAARLRTLDGAITYPEVLNEPVFDGEEPAWEALQAKVLARIRAELPDATVVLTGNHWGSLDGLLALRPAPDRNVVYSFHNYDPPTLTSLASFERGLDTEALKRLPFPAADRPGCDASAKVTAQARTAEVMRFYCSEQWDAAKLRGLVDKAADWGRRHDAVVVCGEFGASNGLPSATRLAWLAAMRQALAANRLGWALWGFDDSMGFAIHPDRAGPAPLNPDVLRALGMAHG